MWTWKGTKYSIRGEDTCGWQWMTKLWVSLVIDFRDSDAKQRCARICTRERESGLKVLGWSSDTKLSGHIVQERRKELESR